MTEEYVLDLKTELCALLYHPQTGYMICSSMTELNYGPPQVPRSVLYHITRAVDGTLLHNRSMQFGGPNDARNEQAKIVTSHVTEQGWICLAMGSNATVTMAWLEYRREHKLLDGQ